MMNQSRPCNAVMHCITIFAIVMHYDAVITALYLYYNAVMHYNAVHAVVISQSINHDESCADLVQDIQSTAC